MKKIFTLFALIVLYTTGLNAQYYYIPFTTAHQNPGGLNTDAEYPVGGGQPAGWTSIQAGNAATPVWSSTGTVPFTFNFNGAAVTGYKVSTSGVLTFTTTAVTVPPVANTALPSASIPDNSICVWGITGSGANDNICYKTFGTAPNQQHWIIFSSYTDPGNAAYTYFAIVLEETTNNIYVVDQRNGGTALTLTIGIQVDASTAYSVSGSPSVAQLAGADATPIDNAYYQFVFGTQAAVDASISNLAPGAGSPSAYTLVNAVNTISCTLTNYGTTPITTIDFKYNDGTNTFTDTKTGLNIPSYGTAIISHSTNYTTPSIGSHPISAWFELSGDLNTSNDSSNTTINGVSFFPVHAVVFEEATGTWCGWCPRGTVFMDSMASQHGAETVLIAVHNSDPMTNVDYDAGVGASPGFTGYPTVFVNRNILDDPSNMPTLFDDHINDFGYANISSATTINTGTNSLDITVTATFATDLSGDYRLAVAVTEDKLTGTTTDWDQHNYYSFQTNNIPLVGGGHDWQAETDPIPAANMEYNHVAREIVGGFTGALGSLPTSIVAGSTYTYNFNYQIPAGMVFANTHVNALLLDNNDPSAAVILNGAAGVVTLGVIENDALIGNFGVSPNPVSDIATISYSLKKQNAVSVSVTNMLGETVYNTDLGSKPAGTYKLDINSTSLNNGLYFVTLVVGDKKYTEKISVNN